MVEHPDQGAILEVPQDGRPVPGARHQEITMEGEASDLKQNKCNIAPEIGKGLYYRVRKIVPISFGLSLMWLYLAAEMKIFWDFISLSLMDLSSL